MKIDLETRIDRDNKLVIKVVVTTGDGDEDQFRLKEIGQLAGLAADGGAASLPLVVRDFYQNGTAYDVYGLVLASDGRTIERHWQPAAGGSGIQHEFVVPGDGSLPDEVVIGAVPRRRGAPEPWPFESRPSDGGGLPADSEGTAGSNIAE